MRPYFVFLTACCVAAMPLAEIRGESETQQPALILEEIIVTATKREVALLDTAMSVGVLTGEDLKESGALDIQDYWRRIPSLIVTDQAFGGNRITIRGLGEEPNGISESMSAIYLNDTPVNQADGLFTQNPDFALIDIERVEVLRGPQGTLFGASAMGGAVRIITQRPELEMAGGTVEVGLSSVAHGGTGFGGSFVWNQPLASSTAVRAVAYYEDRAGWVDDVIAQRSDINDQQTRGARLSVASQLSEAWTVTAMLQYQDRQNGGFNAVDPVGKPDIGIVTTTDYQLVQLSPQYRETEASLGSLVVEYAAAQADWTSITSWVGYDFFVQIDLSEEFRYNNNLPFYLPVNVRTDYEQEAFMQELRAAAKPESKIQWLAGLFYLDQDVPRVDEFYIVDEFQFGQRVEDSRKDFGVFADVTWPMGAAWEGTVGARWYRVEKLNRGFLNQQVSTLDYKEEGLSPKVSVAWQPNDDLTWYGLISRGFRPGGANTPLAVANCGAPEAFESDKLWNYEIGLKSRWQNGRIGINISAYTMDWSEAQVELEVPGCDNVFVANAGEASSSGVEIEVNALLTDAWELQLAAGLNDAQVDQAVPGSGVPAGTAIPLVPDVTAALASTNRFSMMNREAFFRADVQYTGSTTTSLYPAFNKRQDSYTLVSLRLGLDFAAWRLTLFADNVFDEQASLVCCRLDGAFTTNRPRTIGLRGSWVLR